MPRNQDLPRLRRVKLNSRRRSYLSVTPILALGNVSPPSQLGLVVHSSITSTVTEDGLQHLLSRIHVGENHNEKSVPKRPTRLFLYRNSLPKIKISSARKVSPPKNLLDLTAGSLSAHSHWILEKRSSLTYACSTCSELVNFLTEPRIFFRRVNLLDLTAGSSNAHSRWILERKSSLVCACSTCSELVSFLNRPRFFFRRVNLLDLTAGSSNAHSRWILERKSSLVCACSTCSELVSFPNRPRFFFLGMHICHVAHTLPAETIQSPIVPQNKKNATREIKIAISCYFHSQRIIQIKEKSQKNLEGVLIHFKADFPNFTHN